VVASQYDAFVERFAAAMTEVALGDPMEAATIVGPVATAAQRDLLMAQISESVAQGAIVRAGGYAPDRPGFFVAPTVLTDVPSDSRAGCEELFGPVAVVIKARDLDDAIAIANDTPWGLGSSIWATDQAEIDRATVGLEAGMVFANAIVASTPELPFGGIKNSGYGRELSAFGIREFVNIKTYYQV
jgi:succinate-semialdehyde dehydrogenase/glutarate-semialdehyde dehydrogenase